MRGLVFAQSKNQEGRADASQVFIPNAERFAQFYGLGKPIFFDEHARGEEKVPEKIYRALDEARGLDVIAYFGHGLPHGLPSARMKWKDHVEFAKHIQTASSGPCRVLLYACSAGQPGYFASTLQKDLGGSYMVVGHANAGHAVRNPNVTRFPAAPGQEYVIKPGSGLWRAWYCALACTYPTGDLWMRFPFMTQNEIEYELQLFDYEALPSHNKRCPLHGKKPKIPPPAEVARAQRLPRL